MITVCLEVGTKRIFAAALYWPGWCRSARAQGGEEAALEALGAYAPRYAAMAALAGLEAPGVEDGFFVAERLPGSMTTDFGAPGEIAQSDWLPLAPAGATRLAALIGAAWRYLDDVAAGAPEELAKGPRGGGRDRDKVLAHELEAAVSYARKLGVRGMSPHIGDRASVAAFRAAVLEGLGRPWDGQPLAEKGWPPRYVARRCAWHTLDHAWEIQDRTPA